MKIKKNTGNQKFNEDELQLLYESCMAYGNQLTEMCKKLSGCITVIEVLRERACAAYQMATVIASEMAEKGAE